MKIPSFIKINPYKRFNFTPRYYDERKERLEQIKAKYDDENTPEATKARLKGSFKKSNRKGGSSSNVRLIAIVVILSLLAWYFIYN